MREGVVLWGSNNIFNVLPDDWKDELPLRGGLPQAVECRLKGKQLGGTGKGYNVLAPGDRVRLGPRATGASGGAEGGAAGQAGGSPSEGPASSTEPPGTPGAASSTGPPDADESPATNLGPADGMIEERLERKNEFIRWNRKRNAIQTIAANVDLLLAIASPTEPPFRPRFLDRVAVAAELEKIPFGVILNKRDQGIPEDVAERLEVYRRLGYTVLETSATGGTGLERLEALLKGRSVAFVGQSGVGKSSLLNAIAPGTAARVGEVSQKYNRGRHTTTLAVQLPLREFDAAVIDTPGIREIDLYCFPRDQIAWGFAEMKPHIPNCRIPGCTHLHEPDCAVLRAYEAGDIHPDRYESYQRIMIDHEISQKLAGEHRYAAGR